MPHRKTNLFRSERKVILPGSRLLRADGFTLVELLVVIAIIAVLIGILLPVLSKARKQSLRTKCLSNQRQLILAMVMYGGQNKDYLPSGINFYHNETLNLDEYGNRTIDSTAARSKNNWEGLGLLYPTKMLPSGAAFYCPERALVGDGQSIYKQDQWIPPYAKSIDIGYLYRYFGEDEKKGYIPDSEVNTLHPLKLGKLKHKQYDKSTNKQTADSKIMALTSDLMGSRNMGSPNGDWAHPQPFGTTVGYSDGHAEFLQVPKNIALIPRTDPNFAGSANQAVPMEYIWRMFRCYDIYDYADMIKVYNPQ